MDGLPVMVVDEDIYRRPASLLIATVDKWPVVLRSLQDLQIMQLTTSGTADRPSRRRVLRTPLFQGPVPNGALARTARTRRSETRLKQGGRPRNGEKSPF